ncbi:hypothetical protein AVEN_68968-1 [Araneus ventricosus]|uniref:Uncharacterized protein n=1 Tax=Araneus ventricosus TaxID=182803 RepID=A0A4Y2IE89_ARAVE|nr:hypothetical protein AVEN_68968-1 [Araneus ventricosus]
MTFTLPFAEVLRSLSAWNLYTQGEETSNPDFRETNTPLNTEFPLRLIYFEKFESSPLRVEPCHKLIWTINVQRITKFANRKQIKDLENKFQQCRLPNRAYTVAKSPINNFLIS